MHKEPLGSLLYHRIVDHHYSKIAQTVQLYTAVTL